MQYVGILRGISHVDMLLVPKPGLVIGDDLGRTVSAAHSLIQGPAYVSSIRRASARQNKDDRSNKHRNERSALHFQAHSPCSDNFASILIQISLRGSAGVPPAFWRCGKKIPDEI